MEVFDYKKLSGSFSIVIQWSGPPVMIFSWIGVCVVSLAVAYSMAEICSTYPTAGGQYSWVAVLAPPSVARGASWATGWFMITGSYLRSVPRNGKGAYSIPRNPGYGR